jgi:hypothetical protein
MKSRKGSKLKDRLNFKNFNLQRVEEKPEPRIIRSFTKVSTSFCLDRFYLVILKHNSLLKTLQIH